MEDNTKKKTRQRAQSIKAYTGRGLPDNKFKKEDIGKRSSGSRVRKAGEGKY